MAKNKKGNLASKLLLLVVIVLLVVIGYFSINSRSWQLAQREATKYFYEKPNAKTNIKKKKVVKATWGWPFKKIKDSGPKYEDGQQFGKTGYARDHKGKPTYWHDGWDFGWGEVGKNASVLCVHSGVVHKVGWAPGIGNYIWIISKDGYVTVYQEAFINMTDIIVKKGQHVKLGQKLGVLTGNHLHLGVTRTDKPYIKKKYHAPDNNYWSDNGVWLNPVELIKAGLGTK
ncbi:MAG: M23 family metallopeptidase [Lactobacillus sp.]|nr:M23 family metallopeptidase [Lactobacillus sp.]